MILTNTLLRERVRDRKNAIHLVNDAETLDELADALIKAHEVASRDQDNLTLMMIEGALARVGKRLAQRTLAQYS